MRDDSLQQPSMSSGQQPFSTRSSFLAEDALRFRQLEDELREQKNLLGIVMEQMPCGVSIAEAPSGKLLYHNEEAIRLLRHPLLKSADYTGYSQYGALHGVSHPYEPAEYPIARALTGVTIHQEDMLYRRGDGTLTWFSVSAAPVRNLVGDITMAVSTFHDVSALKQQERDREAVNAALEKRVEARTRKIRELASALTLAEQEERRRVALILHDDFQQQLYGVQLRLHMLHSMGTGAELETGLNQAKELVLEAIHTARNLMVELSPPVLGGEGLGVALQWLGDQMNERFGLDVSVHIQEGLPVPGEDMRVLLFQTVRELLFNAVKHAGTSRVWVSLCTRGTDLLIEVKDHGVGFDVSMFQEDPLLRNGLGLHAARERLTLFGGEMNIESGPGAGTRVTLSVPIANL